MTKTLTGIPGLDAITRGGLPQGRATLVAGGAGSGKSILALQFLVNGARRYGEPGIFVAFEEQSRRIVSNAESFGWDLPSLERNGLFFLDAQPNPDLIQSGKVDLAGMLAVLEAKVKAMGARRVAFDAIDVVLALMDDPRSVRREVYRLHTWLADHGLTAIVTGKSAAGYNAVAGIELLDFLQFMVDCSVSLSHDLVDGISQRSLRVTKLRGSAFEENATPFVIGLAGLEIAAALDPAAGRARVTSERISSGVDRLDTMLGGGYYRGASVLLTGSPGTAKTTLCASFAEAACRRGEKTLLISFDSAAEELVRNMKSVGIELAEFVGSGMLAIKSAIASNNNAELHLMRIKELATMQGARCIVVDPLSALAKAGDHGVGHSVAERFIGWTKENGITSVCSSLLDRALPASEGTPLQVSTIADTWIHLDYLVQAGERNRGLSIMKSRGTAHSNQVRELLLDRKGVTLADVYTSDGAVLMGTLRWAKERTERLAGEAALAETDHRRQRVTLELTDLEARSVVVQGELVLKRAEAARLTAAAASVSDELVSAQIDLREKRHADDAEAGAGTAVHA
ncbi:MAG: circadian clock protein KaiC [Alphaproteobacteria bacterium]|nr:circadian clock protein KaiC [Alphaproteobacteria bacterium]